MIYEKNSGDNFWYLKFFKSQNDIHELIKYYSTFHLKQLLVSGQYLMEYKISRNSFQNLPMDHSGIFSGICTFPNFKAFYKSAGFLWEYHVLHLSYLKILRTYQCVGMAAAWMRSACQATAVVLVRSSISITSHKYSRLRQMHIPYWEQL